MATYNIVIGGGHADFVDENGEPDEAAGIKWEQDVLAQVEKFVAKLNDATGATFSGSHLGVVPIGATE